MHDIVIVGGGPAGLCAALYSLRAGKSVVIIEKGAFGGQITYSPKVENYPGYEQASGNQLADAFVGQVLAQGADVEVDEVIGVEDKGEIKTVKTEYSEFDCTAVIIATGAKHRRLGLPDEDSFIGEGISFCAVCDGAFYKDKTVAVIGGGNSALQEAVLLEKTCNKLYIVQNLANLTGEKKLAEQLYASEKTEIIYNSVVTEYIHDDSIRGIKIENTDGVGSELAVDGVFIAIGLEPDNKPFVNLMELDRFGYAASGEDCVTKTAGVFVAGDCRTKGVRQVVTATADGAVAALAACRYIDDIRGKKDDRK